ncbi:MAG: hypothetical protein K9N46_00045 [Candidatus Marinimicrobia bacterium]|nr:hypothetical protein [Candidatus Neomarinimicrobiota bacterium]MCF7829928.1 hypothetical protein [Candidatus Neomarinimicrobiota bacterium]MCF7879109.1 hypothetical protein [Candidatus Neomarinimicrobiota bacterium]
MFVFVVAACTLKQPQEPVSDTQTVERKPNIAFEIQYDEETTTYALHWPLHMVSGFAKSAGSDELLLADYQNIHTTMSIDTAGYVAFSEKNIEGNESVRMPEKPYNAVKDDMPARPNDFDPVVRWDLVDGAMTAFTQSGAVQTSLNIDPEQYRIDPALLDSLGGSFFEDTLDASGRRERLLAGMDRQGVSYKMVGDEDIVISGSIKQDEQSYSTKTMLNLSTGLMVRSAIFNEKQQPLEVSFYRYQKVQGIPVMKYERTYIFGDYEENWEAIYVADTFRDNIKVYRKNSK